MELLPEVRPEVCGEAGRPPEPSPVQRSLHLVVAVSVVTIMVTFSFPTAIPQSQQGALAVEDAELPTGRCCMGSTDVGSEIYLFGGYDGVVLDDILRYEPTSQELSVLDATLPTPREGISAVSTDQAVYLFGGRTSDGPTDEILRFDPGTGNVSSINASLPSDRHGTVALWSGNVAYVIGGQEADGSLVDEVVSFEPGADPSIRVAARLPEGLAGTGGSASDNLILGGETGEAPYRTDRVFRFDGGSVEKTDLSLPTARREVSAASWDDRVFVFGGWDGGAVAEVVRVEPEAETVDVMSTGLPTARYGVATVNHENGIYVLGGQDDHGGVDEILRYDPSMDQAAKENDTPQASFNLTADDLKVSVDASGSRDPDGTVTSYRWTWGDQTDTSSGERSSHTYGADGTYRITLTVVDDDGASARTTQQVSISEPQATLNVTSLQCSPDRVSPGGQVTCSVTVDNTGNATDATEIELKGAPANGSGQVSLETTGTGDIEAGASTTVEVTWTPSEDTPKGEWTLSIGDLESVVEIGTSPVALTDLTVEPASVSPGGTVTVTVTLRNEGQESAEASVPVEVDGSVRETISVNIGVGETQTLETSIQMGESTGDRTISAGSASATVTVSEPEPLPDNRLGNTIKQHPELVDHATDFAEASSTYQDWIRPLLDILDKILSIREKLQSEACIPGYIPEFGGECAWDLLIEVKPEVKTTFNAVDKTESRLQDVQSQLRSVEDASSSVNASVSAYKRDPSQANEEQVRSSFEEAIPVYRGSANKLDSTAGKIDRVGSGVESAASGLREESDTRIIGDAMASWADELDAFAGDIHGVADTVRSPVEDLRQDADIMEEALGSPITPLPLPVAIVAVALAVVVARRGHR